MKQWQALVPLVDHNLTVVMATVTDAAGNECTPSTACQMGLSLTDPFTQPHASLSSAEIGLSQSVALTAATRHNLGAPIKWVLASIPTEADPLGLSVDSPAATTAT